MGFQFRGAIRPDKVLRRVTFVDDGLVCSRRLGQVRELFFEDETVVGELFGFHRAKVRKRMMMMTMSRAVSQP